MENLRAGQKIRLSKAMLDLRILQLLPPRNIVRWIEILRAKQETKGEIDTYSPYYLSSTPMFVVTTLLKLDTNVC